MGLRRTIGWRNAIAGLAASVLLAWAYVAWRAPVAQRAPSPAAHAVPASAAQDPLVALERRAVPARAAASGATSGAAQAAQGAAPADRSCRLLGSVVDERGEGVPGVELVLFDPEVRADAWSARSGKTRGFPRTTSAEAGRYAFAGLDPGSHWRLEVSQGSLPPGYLVPWRGRWPLAEGASEPPFGYDSGLVDLPQPAGSLEYDVRLFRAATVTGVVVDGSGAPMPFVTVEFRTWGEIPRAGVKSSTRTDESGRYVARLHPGQYRRRLFVNRERYPPDRVALPVPVHFEVLEGERLDLGVAVVGAAGIEVIGRIVDQWGEPVADLDVLGYYAGDVPEGGPPPAWSDYLCRVPSGIDGRFRLHGLAAGKVRVIAGPEDYALGREIGEHRLAAFADTIELELQEGEEPRDLGDLTVRVSRPFTLRGAVVFPRSARGEEVLVRFDFLEGERELPERRHEYYRKSVPQSFELSHEENLFEWKCECPFPPVLLRVLRRGSEGSVELRRSVVQPVRDEVVEQTFELSAADFGS